jgi:hypothetical protein
MSSAFRGTKAANFANLVVWQGRSGRHYQLEQHAVADLNMSGPDLYLLSKITNDGEVVAWVGTSADLINDDQSRRDFLKAVNTADNAYVFALGVHETVPPTLIWDLEAATLSPERHAA